MDSKSPYLPNSILSSALPQASSCRYSSWCRDRDLALPLEALGAAHPQGGRALEKAANWDEIAAHCEGLEAAELEITGIDLTDADESEQGLTITLGTAYRDYGGTLSNKCSEELPFDNLAAKLLAADINETFSMEEVMLEDVTSSGRGASSGSSIHPLGHCLSGNWTHAESGHGVSSLRSLQSAASFPEQLTNMRSLASGGRLASNATDHLHPYDSLAGTRLTALGLQATRMKAASCSVSPSGSPVSSSGSPLSPSGSPVSTGTLDPHFSGSLPVPRLRRLPQLPTPQMLAAKVMGCQGTASPPRRTTRPCGPTSGQLPFNPASTDGDLADLPGSILKSPARLSASCRWSGEERSLPFSSGLQPSRFSRDSEAVCSELACAPQPQEFQIGKIYSSS